MNWLKRLLPPQLPGKPPEDIKLPAEPAERFLSIRGWLASLSPADRTRFSEKYLVPVFGEQAAEWVKQQLVAERAKTKAALDADLAQLRTSYAKEIQPLILQHIRETFAKVDAETSRASFRDPIIRSLWKVAVARTGLDIIAAGQTTFDDMLKDFDKLLEVLLRMSKAYESDADRQSGG